MTEPRPPGTQTGSDETLERALSDALATPTWKPADRERVRAAVGHEWRATTLAARPQPRTILRHPWYLGLAAALAVVALGLLVRGPVSSGAALGQVARVLDGGVEVRYGLVRHRALAVGDPVRIGDRLTAHGLVLLTLAQGGTLRIAAGTTVVFPGATQVGLEQGLIYVDCPAHPITCDWLRVTTVAGIIDHVGTEFEVLSDEQSVRIRVREGRIRFVGRSAALYAEAGTELLAAAGGRVALQPIATYGRDWLWTAALAPDYQIEGRSLIEFLQWASRELGRPLEFADAHAQQVANQTILHGSIKGVDPLDALAQVLATTSLSYEIASGIIRVHSSP
jgi:hypothetical protein